MASMRNRLKHLLQSYRQGQHEETIQQAIALADEGGRPSAVACNLVAYLMVQQGFGSVPPDFAQKRFHTAVRYYEIASGLAPNCVETAASHGAALLSQKLWDQAQRELERGLNISDADCLDPLLHHVTVMAEGCSKGQRIDDAKQRIISDLSYIEIVRQDHVFAKVIKKLRRPNADAAGILKDTEKLVVEKKSPRAKLVYAQIALELLRGKHLKEHEKHPVLRCALTFLDDMSSLHPNSLVVCQHKLKLLLALGRLDATEKECCRAFQIEKPDDPRDHDSPLRSTKGYSYQTRVSLVRMQILPVLNVVVSLVRQRFDALGEEEKADLISVKVETLQEIYEEKSASIHEAICYYKGHSRLPRVFWSCPFESASCPLTAQKPQELLYHICDHIVTDVTNSAVLTRLMLCEFTPEFDNSYEALYLARDDEGCERLCYTSLDALFVQIEEVLTGSKRKTNSQSSSFSTFLECVSRFQSDVNNIDASIALENAWLQILQNFAVDKCELLMVLVTTTKWEELKNILEKQFSEEEKVKWVVDKQTIDLQTSGVVEVQGSELLFDEHALETACSKSVPRNHAFMYGHRALRHRNSVTDEVTPAEDNDDPYANKATHAEYADARLKKLPHQETCTVCFFERGGKIKHINHILIHMLRLHGSVGVKCPMCSARFLTAMMLSYHMYYTHNVQIMEPPG